MTAKKKKAKRPTQIQRLHKVGMYMPDVYRYAYYHLQGLYNYYKDKAHRELTPSVKQKYIHHMEFYKVRMEVLDKFW